MSTIETLELEIVENSKSAISGIDALTSSLKTLKGATHGKLGLTAIAKEIESFNKADVKSTKDKIVTLSAALNSLNMPKSNLSSYISPLKALPKAIEGLNSVNTSTLSTKLRELVSSLDPLMGLEKSNLGSFITPLKKLPQVLADLNKLDMSALAAKIQEVATAMKPLADEMQKVSNGFSAMPSKLQKLLNATNKIPTSNAKAAKSFTDLYHKMKMGWQIVRQAASTFGEFVKQSMDYTENLNLFTVAMGSGASGAREYAESLESLVGIDSSEWMRNQGIFMTLATGFGVASDRASVMSENLTQLGYDISSFFNISYAESMQKLQSGLAGELEPLRRLGYDLSQAKLEATALALGIDKSVSSMTQAEKAQLRYYAIMTQVTQSHGDLARTLDAPANQFRVLKAQISITARNIGNIFIPIISKTLPYVIALTKVVGSLAKKLAELAGYTEFKVKTDGIEVVSTTSEETSNALSDAVDSAKKLKNYMMGFDELNVLNPDTDSTDSIVDAFNIPLPTYDFLDGLQESRVDSIINKTKEWLGLTKEINSIYDLVGTRFGSIVTIIGTIGTVIGTILAHDAITKFVAFIPTITTFLTTLGTKLTAIFTPLTLVITAVVAGLGSVYATNEQVRDSVGKAISTIKTALTPLLTFLSDTVIPNLKSAWEGVINILSPFTNWLNMVFTSLWNDIIIPILNYLGTSVLPPIVSGFKMLWNDVLVPLCQFLGAIFAPLVAELGGALTILWKVVVIPLADAIGSVLNEVWVNLVKIIRDGVMPIFSGLITFLSGVFLGDWKKAWEGASSIFEGVWKGLLGIVTGTVDVMVSLIEGAINAAIGAVNAILSFAIDVPEWLGGGSYTLGITIPKVKLPRFEDAFFANGGFPTEGQMFIAREAGAEMVGSIGRRTAVANNDQIVGGIASGVASANEEQNALLREQNSLLRAILEKDSGVYLDGKNLANSVEKYQRERGRVLITGGVL